MEILVSAPVMSSEDPGRILDALRNIFPMMQFKGRATLQSSTTDRAALEQFKELMRRQKIRDTARPFLERRSAEGTLKFSLNKQAAAMGVVNFQDFEQPLGAIDVEIRDVSLTELVDWLCEISTPK